MAPNGTNGTNGTDGTNGANGANGTNGAGLAFSVAAASADQCTYGGFAPHARRRYRRQWRYR